MLIIIKNKIWKLKFEKDKLRLINMFLLCFCFCDIYFVFNFNKIMCMIMCICIYCNLKKLGERRDEKNNISIK